MLRTDDSFTMSAWAMIDSLDGSRTIVSQRGLHESAGWLKYTETSGKWSFVVSDEDVTTTATEYVSSTSAANDGVWTHLTGVYDASSRELRIYVNGRLQGTKAVAFTPMKSSGPLLVGRTLWHDQVLDQWSGGIDDVKVFQGAMTDTAVFNMYNSQTPTTPGTNTLAKGERLTAGQYLRSDVGNYQLLMQEDSNLVLYQAGFPLWHTDTGGPPGTSVVLQDDSNLVVYRIDGTPVWHSDTRGTNASQLVLRDDGDLVLLDPGGAVVWRR
ncbi:LamG-like jellyroll fold domain-containing protein [Micromonospora sp. M12]